MMKLERSSDVFVLTLDNGENRIDLEFANRMNAALDEVEAGSEGDGALVIVGTGKFFSNGLNLEWLMPAERAQKVEFGASFKRALGRLATGPIPTVAALNGHTFAAGMILALACDFRVIRADRGWMCLPEINLGIALDEAMWALCKAKLPPATLRDAILTAKRYAADEAIAAGLADEKASEDAILERAVEIASGRATVKRSSYQMMKTGLYGDLKGLFGLE